MIKEFSSLKRHGFPPIHTSLTFFPPLTLIINERGFPGGGSVVKNPPVNAGDAGLIPDPGRSHALQSS